MNIDYAYEKNPVKGVSLIKSLLVDIPKSFNIDELTVDINATTPVDQHEVAEFWLILSGKGKLFYKNEEYILNRGDWFLFLPNEKHQVKNEGYDELRILSIYWKSHG